MNRLGKLLRTWGPAWLVMIADVDAASVITAAQDGASYGTKLIWFLCLLTIPLFIIQEVAGRVGAVTGKGLGELIRENFSRRTAALAAFPMAAVDIISYVTEYTGIAIGFSLFGISPFITVPCAFIVHVFLVYRRKYVQAERPLIVVSLLFAVAYAVSALMVLKRGGIEFTPVYVSGDPDFLFLIAANVGAVIMPFMLFYQVSATAEKGTTAKDLWAVRLETGLGAVVSEVMMVAIGLATVGMDGAGLNFAEPKVLSQGLSHVAGSAAPYVFGVGLIAASFIALVVVSLGSSWGVTEALGWGRKNWFRVYLVESVPALVVPLISLNLVHLALNLMVLQIVVLIVPAIVLARIAANRKVMGEHSLGGLNGVVYWVVLLMILTTGVLSLKTVI